MVERVLSDYCLLPSDYCLFRNASCDGYLHKELGEVQHRFHRGPRWFVGREKLGVLLVVGCKVLTFGQMRQHRQNIIERTSGCLQNHFDALDGILLGFSGNTPQVLLTVVGSSIKESIVLPALGERTK